MPAASSVDAELVAGFLASAVSTATVYPIETTKASHPCFSTAELHHVETISKIEDFEFKAL